MLHSEAQGRHRLARRKVSPEPPLAGLAEPVRGSAQRLSCLPAAGTRGCPGGPGKAATAAGCSGGRPAAPGEEGHPAAAPAGGRQGKGQWSQRRPGSRGRGEEDRCPTVGEALLLPLAMQKRSGGGSSDPPPPCSAFPNRRRKPSWRWSNGSVRSLAALPFPRARAASERFEGV